MSSQRLWRQSNMFDLDQAMAEWRRQMLAGGIKTPVPLEELESHLREEIERQTKSGLIQEEAFNVAVQRIGPAPMLESEFKKVQSEKDCEKQRRREKVFIAATVGQTMIFSAPLLFKLGNVSLLTSGQQMSCWLAIATNCLLIGGGRLGYGIFPVIHSNRIRFAIDCGCWLLLILWWTISALIILPRSYLTMGQLLVAVFWGFMTPWGAVAGISWGFQTAARKKAALLDS